MWRITKTALLWSGAIRLIIVLLGLIGIWLSDRLDLPASQIGGMIGGQIGRALVPAFAGIIVAAFFYYPTKNAWWEERGRLPAIITVCLVSALTLFAEIHSSNSF